MHCFQTCTFSADNLDHAENTASGSGPLARGRSAVTRRHKFDLAARTLLARAGKYMFDILLLVKVLYSLFIF